MSQRGHTESQNGESENRLQSKKLLSVSILPYWTAKPGLHPFLERSANGKPEQRPFLKVRKRLTELRHRVDERVLVGERRAVRHDRRLEGIPAGRRGVGPDEPEPPALRAAHP